MKIETAIKILSVLSGLFDARTRWERIDALQLGIEALKRLQQQRIDESHSTFWQLPGETKE